jgi:hypothetical protein
VTNEKSFEKSKAGQIREAHEVFHGIKFPEIRFIDYAVQFEEVAKKKWLDSIKFTNYAKGNKNE